MTAYDLLANEYYDARHVTSRNFDVTTTAATAAWRSAVPAGLVLEPGAGRGRVGEFLGVSPDRVIQLDSSSEMLSLPEREDALLRVLHDAEELPFPTAEFSCVAAFLCDGFLGLNFLSEARRVLKAGGVLYGTTPSYEWGSSLRKLLGLDLMTTRFESKTGRQMLAPSFLYQKDQLTNMLGRAGFADVVDVQEHSLPSSVVEVSLDITRAAESLGVAVQRLPILYSFKAAV